MPKERMTLTRRDVLRLGLATGAATIVGRSAFAQTCVDQTPIPIHEVEFTGCGYDGEVFPTSPFIMDPFTQDLPVPRALRPGWRLNEPFAPLAAPGDPNAWYVRESQRDDGTFGPGISLPGPGRGRQDALGDRPVFHSEMGLPNAGTHQLWANGPGTNGLDLGLPEPLLYHIRVQLNEHSFTNSRVVNIDKAGLPVGLPVGTPAPASAGTVTFNGLPAPAYYLPKSVIYGFNGTFPGPMVNSDYGKPVLIRFENDLDLNPNCRDRQDFGAPDWAFLTHLHNGHTAPESDGNPHHLVDNEGGYLPGQWSDNLYLQYPAGNDPTEKQSFLWFHDHRMHHTGPNVYKGMVGLMPHYDSAPEPGFPGGRDPGDETRGLRLPGVRTDNGDGSFDVDYDIPMAFYDCVFDDGLAPHQDAHTPFQNGPGYDPNYPSNYCGNTHPEWWGKLFLKHYVNHGFVGDVFTVNCVAYPKLVVKRRKYRLRFLGASLARCYELSLRVGTPMPFPGKQGQWLFGEVTTNVGKKGAVLGTTTKPVKGTQAMTMLQIASEGGLLPTPIVRNSIEIWPAKRREVIVDFTKYKDGTPTSPGDVIYLTNTMQMLDGRKPTTAGEPGFDSQYAVPLVKIVIDPDGAVVADNSLTPIAGKTVLRPAPAFNRNATPQRTFTLERGGGVPGDETEWLINGLEFSPLAPLALPRIGSTEAWAVNNGGGGWTHPMHIHMEEHHVIWRSENLQKHVDDTGKEDVVALEPGEQTTIVRQFRTFLGNYVAHCHNLAHEDHNMMFGWTIVP